MDVLKLQETLRLNIGDMTFREAYDVSGRVLNITVSSASRHGMPSLLNYLTAPNVVCVCICFLSVRLKWEVLYACKGMAIVCVVNT